MCLCEVLTRDCIIDHVWSIVVVTEKHYPIVGVAPIDHVWSIVVVTEKHYPIMSEV